MAETSSNEPTAPRAWSLVLCCFLAIAGFFLLTEHAAHLFGALPYLLLLLCPIMHLVMHRGHRGHGHRRVPETNDDPRT